MCCRPLRANLSHAPVSLLPHSAFCLGRLVSAKSCSSKPFPGQEEQLRGSRGKKGRFSRLAGGPWDTPNPHPHYWQKCSRNIHESGAGRNKTNIGGSNEIWKASRMRESYRRRSTGLNCNILNCWAWLCAINIFCEPPEWQKYDMTWKAKWLQIAGKIRRMPIWHKPLWDHHLCNLRARTKFVYYLNLKKFFTTTNGEVGIWHIDINIDIDIDINIDIDIGILLNTWCWWFPALDTFSLQ